MTRTKYAQTSFFGIEEKTMSSTSDPTAQWDRVARELRACKENQQKAWGDIDSTTLGRYLAGEASGEERAAIEQALSQLPDLRALTDLVRDVLADAPAATAGPPDVAPVHLPFQPKADAQPPLHPSTALNPRSALVAAACLLLVFGLAMPQTAYLSAPRGQAPRLNGAVAMRSVGSLTRTSLRAAESSAAALSGNRDSRNEPPDRGSMLRPAGDELPAPRLLNDSPAPAPAPPPLDPRSINPRKAAELNRMAFHYTANGDLARAVTPLYQAHWMCLEKLGPNHPTTQKTARQLANVYLAALNAPPSPPADASAPKFGPHTSMKVGTAARPRPAPHGKSNLRATSPPGGPPQVPTETYFRAALKLREQIANQSAHDVQKEVVVVLAQALQTAPTAKERLDLVKALASLGPAARTALPVLTDRLKKSEDPGEVKEVLLALNEMGPAARDALPAVLALSNRYQASQRVHVQRPMQMTFAKKMPTAPKGVSEVKSAPVEEQQVRQALACLEGVEGRCGIDDRAGCFSVQALRRSTRFIRALAQRQHVELLFETVQLAADAEKALPKEVRRHDRLKAMGARAIHVVFAPQSNTFEVHVSDALRRDGVKPEVVCKQLLERCCDKPHDKALDESIHLVAEVAATK
jgi:hypothetical protein